MQSDSFKTQIKELIEGSFESMQVAKNFIIALGLPDNLLLENNLEQDKLSDILMNFVCRIKYRKNNGEVVERVGLVNLNYIPSSEHPTGGINYAKAVGYTTYWDLEKYGWRNCIDIIEIQPLYIIDTETETEGD